MAFPAKTLDTLRGELLAYWQAEYAAADPPRVLLVSPGGDA